VLEFHPELLGTAQADNTSMRDAQESDTYERRSSERRSSTDATGITLLSIAKTDEFGKLSPAEYTWPTAARHRPDLWRPRKAPAKTKAVSRPRPHRIPRVRVTHEQRQRSRLELLCNRDHRLDRLHLCTRVSVRARQYQIALPLAWSA
jgi:hypothetical protein